MNVRRTILVVAVSALLAACGAGGPGLSALESDLQGLLETDSPGGSGGGSASTPNPSASGLAPGNGPTVGGPTAPPAGPAGTIRGTITFHANGRTEDQISRQVVEHTTDATFDIRLVRDTTAEDEYYVDDGSTYDVSVLVTTELPGANCTATSRSEATEHHAFADQPTSYENSIDAAVLRDEGMVLISALYSWTLRVTGNDCDGRAATNVETSGGLECPFGLMAKLIEGAATDQIDTACTLPGGETYAGILTLTP